MKEALAKLSIKTEKNLESFIFIGADHNPPSPQIIPICGEGGGLEESFLSVFTLNGENR